MSSNPVSKQPITPEVITQDEVPEFQVGLLNMGQTSIDLSNVGSQIEEICGKISTTNPDELAKIATIKLTVPVMLVTGPAQITEVTLK